MLLELPLPLTSCRGWGGSDTILAGSFFKFFYPLSRSETEHTSAIWWENTGWNRRVNSLSTGSRPEKSIPSLRSAGLLPNLSTSLPRHPTGIHPLWSRNSPSRSCQSPHSAAGYFCAFRQSPFSQRIAGIPQKFLQKPRGGCKKDVLYAHHHR